MQAWTTVEIQRMVIYERMIDKQVEWYLDHWNLISKARAGPISHNMHDMFNIGKVKNNGKNLEAKTKELFTNTWWK